MFNRAFGGRSFLDTVGDGFYPHCCDEMRGSGRGEVVPLGRTKAPAYGHSAHGLSDRHSVARGSEAAPGYFSPGVACVSPPGGPPHESVAPSVRRRPCRCGRRALVYAKPAPVPRGSASVPPRPPLPVTRRWPRPARLRRAVPAAPGAAPGAAPASRPMPPRRAPGAVPVAPAAEPTSQPAAPSVVPVPDNQTLAENVHNLFHYILVARYDFANGQAQQLAGRDPKEALVAMEGEARTRDLDLDRFLDTRQEVPALKESITALKAKLNEARADPPGRPEMDSREHRRPGPGRAGPPERHGPPPPEWRVRGPADDRRTPQHVRAGRPEGRGPSRPDGDGPRRPQPSSPPPK